MSNRSFHTNNSKIFQVVIVIAAFISTPSFGASFYTADILAEMTVSLEVISGGGGSGGVYLSSTSEAITTPASEIQQGHFIVNANSLSAPVTNGYSLNITSSGSALPVTPPGSLAEANFDSSMNYIRIYADVTDTTTGGSLPISRLTFNCDIFYSVDFGVDNPLYESSSASVDYIITTGEGINETILTSGIIDTVSTGSITDQFSVDFVSSSNEIASLYVGSFGQATSVVPIPAAAWLFGSGLIGLIGLARRKA